MAEMVITELRRSGQGSEPTLVQFRWTSATHSSAQGSLVKTLKVMTKKRTPGGSSTPVEQVLSVSWQPMELEGEWKDSWGGAGFSASTELEFTRMCGRTPLVRIEIDQESIVGIITDLVVTKRTEDHRMWKFTLSQHKDERIGDFRLSANRVPPQPVTSRVETALDALDDLTDLALSVKNLPVSSPGISESVGQLVELGDATARAKSISENGVPQDAERKLLIMATTFRRVQGAAQTVFDDISRQRDDLTLASESAIDILKFEVWQRGTLNNAARTIGTARLAELDMRSKASQKPKAIHVAKKGESLERIALRYTGSADNWRTIYDVNNLDSIILEGGERLIIPERAS